MEDVQDGKKVSIQDGVTEDPAIPVYTKGRGMAIVLNVGTPLEAMVTDTELVVSVSTNKAFIGANLTIKSVTVT